MKNILVLLLFLFQLHPLFAQNINPGEDEIYRTSEIARILLTMDPSDKAFMLAEENIWSDIYLPATFHFVNSTLDTTLEFNVGIRLRGNTSRSHPKKSFKLKFKEFEGSKFFGYKKFNLKAENNDPTMIRELMALQTFRNANTPAARSHPAEVYINDEYMGLYLNVEQIDDEFTDSRFNHDSGNLYKCGWGATLTTNNPIYDNDLFELETNEDINDRSILAHFIDVLNHASDAEFEAAIEEVFDVDDFLMYLAVEALTGHWDGYSVNKNNFYLYEGKDGFIEFIVYDIDNTFGIDWIGGDWGTRDVLNWAEQNDPRPLTNRILDRTKYLDQYKKNLEDLMESIFNEDEFYPEFDRLRSLLAESVANDVYFPLTFGFSFADFENSYMESVADHLPYGLKPYVTTRINYAKEQLGIASILNAVQLNFSTYPNPNNGRKLIINTEHAIEQLDICDALGRKYTYSLKELDEHSYELDFNLESGLYVIQIDGRSKPFLVK